MLSTLAMFVMGVAALVYRKRRGRIALHVVREDARRDLTFFLPVFLVLVIVGTIDVGPTIRYALAAALLLIYARYTIVMLRLKRDADTEVDHGLYFESFFRGNPMKPRSWTTAAQVIFGVAFIIVGAKEFVDQVIEFSHHVNLNPGVLSLILSPLATELPEKFNSVIWIRQRKDHLALANITGAMVFQSCIPVALGLAFSPWHLSPSELLAGAIALVTSTILYFNLRDAELGTPTLMVGGIAYLIFLSGVAYLGGL